MTEAELKIIYMYCGTNLTKFGRGWRGNSIGLGAIYLLCLVAIIVVRRCSFCDFVHRSLFLCVLYQIHWLSCVRWLRLV